MAYDGKGFFFVSFIYGCVKRVRVHVMSCAWKGERPVRGKVRGPCMGK